MGYCLKAISLGLKNKDINYSSIRMKKRTVKNGKTI